MITEQDKRDTVIKFGTLLMLLTLDTIEEMDTMSPRHVIDAILQQYTMTGREYQFERAPEAIRALLQKLYQKAAFMTADVLWKNKAHPTTAITSAWLVAFREVIESVLPGDSKIYEEILTHFDKLLASTDGIPGIEMPVAPAIAFSRN